MGAGGDRGRASAHAELFWEVVEPLFGRPGVEEGTLMGFPCVRAGGEFFAMPHHETGDLVVKLPAPRVAELVQSGVGQPFGPGDRTFKEWVLVPRAQQTRWEALLDEATAFVSGPA